MEGTELFHLADTTEGCGDAGRIFQGVKEISNEHVVLERTHPSGPARNGCLREEVFLVVHPASMFIKCLCVPTFPGGYGSSVSVLTPFSSVSFQVPLITPHSYTAGWVLWVAFQYPLLHHAVRRATDTPPRQLCCEVSLSSFRKLFCHCSFFLGGSQSW